MSDATCKTCPWCRHLPRTAGQQAYGKCHVDPPGRAYIVPMVVLDEDWCREHPDRRSPHTNLTEADVRRIVVNQLACARRAIRNATGGTP